MKIPSKSILSPARGGVRDPQISLSTSLSRRLKGGASPAMFPTTGGRKRGYGFDSVPEPSSPKVTCIGQVRVKSRKKQGKKLRTLSRRHSTGEVSFQKSQHSPDGFLSQSQNQPNNQNQECRSTNISNQRWVHLPLTICEALRAFGSEFSCLFTCQSSCLQDGGGREIELAVKEEDADEEEEVRNTRRHVFEDLEIVNDRIEGCKEEARMSICVPPKNALLLMRCRSDPVKVEALANRNWEPNVGQSQGFDEIEEERVKLEQAEDEKVMGFEEDNDQQRGNVGEDEVPLDTNVEEEIQVIGAERVEDCEEIMFLGSLFEQDHDIEAQEEETGAAEESVKDLEESMFLGSLFDQGQELIEEEEESAVEEENGSVLPECLKLSMEVSKETWVRRTVFIRSHKKPPTVKPSQETPKVMGPRWSCSPSVVEQKVGVFGLTRCKSEPMRTAAAKLMPESCVWENRKMERLKPGAFGVGRAGLGF